MTQNPPTFDPLSLLTVNQAAAELGLSHRAVVHRIRRGAIAATKIGPGTAPYVLTRAELDRAKAADIQQPEQTEQVQP